jgi:tetratricopeptide (TPR) repeat protein
MFPHHKLDWNVKRLEKSLEKIPDDINSRLTYALALYSKGRFHDGGEPYFNKALTESRRVLQYEPANVKALLVAGASLVGLNRLDKAQETLERLLTQTDNQPEYYLAIGDLQWKQGLKHQAIRSFETTCRLAPKAWEGHALLGLLLKSRAEDLGYPKRMLERSQFHIVRALQFEAAGPIVALLTQTMGVCCLETGRLDDALTMFQKLQDHPHYKIKARYYLGLVAYHLGKYKNAILYLRQHQRDVPDNPRVHSRIGVCYLHLGEVEKAREACNRALAIAPGDPQARWTLGCALLEEGREEDATRIFRELLADVPEHAPAFQELARLRRNSGDRDWLLKALRSEVALHDRLPIESTSAGSGRTIQPRAATRERVHILLDAIGQTAARPEIAIIQAMALTTDEGLRFQLWETLLDQVAKARATTVTNWLRTPHKHYSADTGREVVAVASHIPESLLTGGLQLSEEDLRRSAVHRHGSTADIARHRAHIEDERNQARAWQALLLVAIGLQKSRTGRNLLVRWATEADEELANAARAALVLQGDQESVRPLRQHANRHKASHLLDHLLKNVAPTHYRASPRPVSGDEQLTCSICKKRSGEVDHMITGQGCAVCDRCLTTIARDRRKLRSEDPKVQCALSGTNCLESKGIFVFQEVAVSAECLEQSLGLLEREEIDRYLASC